MSHDDIITLDHSPREIPLTQGQVAIVCQHDYDWLTAYRWHATKENGKGGGFYAVRWAQDGKKRIKVRMHREVASTPAGMETDHKHHKTLDNRCHELRNVTDLINSRNKKPRKSIKSGHTGVYSVTWEGYHYWIALINTDGKSKYLGSYKTVEEAVAVRKAAEVKYGYGST